MAEKALHDCSMFPEGRERLWKEKLGLIPRFAGNAATRWGTNQEEVALARSVSESSQHILCPAPFTRRSACCFQQYDLRHVGWSVLSLPFQTAAHSLSVLVAASSQSLTSAYKVYFSTSWSSINCEGTIFTHDKAKSNQNACPNLQYQVSNPLVCTSM